MIKKCQLMAAALVIVSLVLTACGAETTKTIWYLSTDVADGQGSVDPSIGTFHDGDTVTITAEPESGWNFDYWNGDASGNENPITITMDSDKTIYAYFVLASTPTPTPIPTPTPKPTPLPTEQMSCTEARDAIQNALDAYHAEYGEWPTADGQTGDIEWTKIIPDFMAAVPANDSQCDWQVNSNPEGEVCLLHQC
jgi:hypothetical protein